MIKQILVSGLIFIILCLAVLSGCSEKKASPVSSFPPDQVQVLKDKAVAISPEATREEQDDTWVLEDETALSQIENPAAQATGPGPGIERPLPTMPVTMKMNDIQLPVLIRTLARVADLDIILTDTVQGTTRIAITNIPWDQAFTGILNTYGLTYEWSGGILKILSVKDLEKRQALMEARQNLQKSRDAHSLELMDLAQASRLRQPKVTKIVKIHYADLDDLQQNLTAYLSGNEQSDATKAGASQDDAGTVSSQAEQDFNGTILKDRFSNSLIIHATRRDILKVMPIIRRLDQPVRQILIEAHIVEAESNTGRELGIQWGGLGTKNGANDKSYSIGGGSITEYGSTLDEGYDPTDSTVVNLPLSDADGKGMTLGVMAEQAGIFVLYAQLSALEKEGKLDIISKPSVTTLDHRKAVIRSGREVPYQSVVDDDVSIEWKEAVIKLEVTPHIIDDKIVRLEIITHKDELDFANEVNGTPTVITKTAETNVMLFDGQTTVIGGLNKEKINNSETGVPGLRKVPGLGKLFSSTNDVQEREELMIFITPKILKGMYQLPAGS